MDDMEVFGKNKKELHRMQQEIERFLRDKFNLQMKGNWQVFRIDYTEKKTGKKPLSIMPYGTKPQTLSISSIRPTSRSNWVWKV